MPGSAPTYIHRDGEALGNLTEVYYRTRVEMGAFGSSEAAHHEAEWTEDQFLELYKPVKARIVRYTS